jgi:NAD(P)-dependent dehydrogenase (short-subunit alcohol dehydrogenase family)
MSTPPESPRPAPAAGPLAGRVALVAGATRGAGRGIAVALGAAGATVYCTGRSTATARSAMNRPETIEETAARVTAAGGRGIAVAVDHLVPDEVRRLVERIAADGGGRLDVLVNDIWGGDPLTRWDVPFWEHPLEDGLRLLRVALETHLITSWHAVPLLVARGRGLVVEVTDGADARYRGSLFYDLAKSGTIRLALGQAEELRPHGVTAVAVTPGFLRSEAMLDHFGVTADGWRDAVARDPHFAYSETPAYVGRAVAALAADPDVARWSGQALASWQLAKAYGFADADGTRPDWGRYFEEVVEGGGPPLGDYR